MGEKKQGQLISLSAFRKKKNKTQLKKEKKTAEGGGYSLTDQNLFPEKSGKDQAQLGKPEKGQVQVYDISHYLEKRNQTLSEENAEHQSGSFLKNDNVIVLADHRKKKVPLWKKSLEISATALVLFFAFLFVVKPAVHTAYKVAENKDQGLTERSDGFRGVANTERFWTYYHAEVSRSLAAVVTPAKSFFTPEKDYLKSGLSSKKYIQKLQSHPPKKVITGRRPLSSDYKGF